MENYKIDDFIKVIKEFDGELSDFFCNTCDLGCEDYLFIFHFREDFVKCLYENLQNGETIVFKAYSPEELREKINSYISI